MEVNCSAIPENLLEAELFGHEKGAFTDAKAQKKGLLEISHGGTLFLDEIGHMGPQLQVKLLKAIEEKTYRSNRIEERLQEMITEGTVLVDTEGNVEGQINGLAVLGSGDYEIREIQEIGIDRDLPVQAVPAPKIPLNMNRALAHLHSQEMDGYLFSGKF